MNRALFLDQRQEEWLRFERMVAELESKGRSEDAFELPSLYRRVCQDLALVRSRSYGADLESRLHPLVLRGHQLLYRGHPLSWERVVDFLAVGFPRLVREETRLVLLCSALFLLPMVGVVLALSFDGDLIYSLLKPEQVMEYEAMYADEGTFGRESDSDVLMFGFYIYNNIGIALRTFATGIFFGIGAIFTLVFNGLFLGAVGGHLVASGYGGTFLPFVVGHGAFELTGIVLAGVAGTRLGLSLITPGNRSRIGSLAVQSRRLVPMIWGIILLLLLAAFVEAFWSSSGAPAPVRYGVGAALWIAVISYFVFGGRRR
ncbi:MAG: stage II sporulation protein M [Thermoanaerobaculia bacterium]|nr:stage II sporulation protein M [Thermoanaerobaculia bacterium]